MVWRGTTRLWGWESRDSRGAVRRRGWWLRLWSQAAEGVLVNAPDTTYSMMGLYYSTDAGVTWQMATIEDGSQVVQGTGARRLPGNAATAVVWNPVRQMFYAAVRFHGYYQSVDGMTWTRMTTSRGQG